MNLKNIPSTIRFKILPNCNYEFILDGAA